MAFLLGRFYLRLPYRFPVICPWALIPVSGNLSGLVGFLLLTGIGRFLHRLLLHFRLFRQDHVDHIPAFKRRLKRHMNPVQRNIHTIGRPVNIPQTSLCPDARHRRHKINGIPCVDDIRQFSLFLVDQQRGRLRSAAIEDLPGPVDDDHQILSGPSQKIPEIVPVHHQQIQGRKAAAAEQFCRLIV